MKTDAFAAFNAALFAAPDPCNAVTVNRDIKISRTILMTLTILLIRITTLAQSNNSVESSTVPGAVHYLAL